MLIMGANSYTGSWRSLADKATGWGSSAAGEATRLWACAERRGILRIRPVQ